jgi:hypothetical protein
MRRASSYRSNFADLLKNFAEQVERPGNVKAALPLATLEAQQNLALPVEVAVPVAAVLRVAKVLPRVVVDALVPVGKLLSLSQLIAQRTGDKCFDMDPPATKDGEGTK